MKSIDLMVYGDVKDKTPSRDFKIWLRCQACDSRYVGCLDALMYSMNYSCPYCETNIDRFIVPKKMIECRRYEKELLKPYKTELDCYVIPVRKS